MSMRFLVVMMLMALVVGACGSDAGEEVEPTVPQGTPGSVILEISDEGGFVPVEFNLQRVPRFTVFADGTVVAPEGEQFRFPGPAIPRLKAFRIDEAILDDLITFVTDLGLADIQSQDINNATNVADASTTVVRYFDGGGEHRLSIYALGFESGDAREAIVSSMLSTLERASQSSRATGWQADRIVVHAQSAANFDPEAQTTSRPWPFDFSPDDMTAEFAGTTCRTLEGDAATTAVAELESADALTIWNADGDEFRIFARPLLPHQDGC